MKYMIFPWPPVLVENILKILVEAQNNSESHCVYKTTYSYTHNAVVSVRSFNSLQTVHKSVSYQNLLCCDNQ